MSAKSAGNSASPTVLEGSVQRGGSRVRITVQLIETAGGAHLWAEKDDGTLDDVFDLQDRITEHVAGALQPSIRQAEIERARRKRPQDLGAYDYTMRAMRHVWALEKDEAGRALRLLEQALEIDGDYPLALALSAWCWAQHSVYNWVDDMAAAKAQALKLADRAADLSTDDPLILAVLGAVHTLARHYGAARVVLERAVALDPNAAWALSRLGWLDVYVDRPDDAKVHFEKALRLSPLDPMNFNNYVGYGLRPASGWRLQCCRRSVHPCSSRAPERALGPSEPRHGTLRCRALQRSARLSRRAARCISGRDHPAIPGSDGVFTGDARSFLRAAARSGGTGVAPKAR